jgi:large subunit ribosomal protein L31e
MVEEKIITLNLRKYALMAPRWRRARRIVKAIKESIEKKLKTKTVLIGASLNEFIWQRGAKNPITRIKVRAVKDGEKVTVDLIEIKKKREEIKEEKEKKKEKEKAEDKKKEVKEEKK